MIFFLLHFWFSPRMYKLFHPLWRLSCQGLGQISLVHTPVESSMWSFILPKSKTLNLFSDISSVPELEGWGWVVFERWAMILVLVMFYTYTGMDLSSNFNLPFRQLNLVVLLSIRLPRGLAVWSSVTDTEESWSWLPGRVIEVIWSWLSDNRIKSRSPHWLPIQWDAVKTLATH